MFDLDEFIDGYVEAALWADCMPAEPDDRELIEHALMQGATREYVADADTDRLRADYLDSWRDTAEFGGGEGLHMRAEGRALMAEDCVAFAELAAADLALYCELRPVRIDGDGPSAYAGHDFWLTRQGHGTGFWDRELGELGERLTEAARSFGSASGYPFDCGDGSADYL